LVPKEKLADLTKKFEPRKEEYSTTISKLPGVLKTHSVHPVKVSTFFSIIFFKKQWIDTTILFLL